MKRDKVKLLPIFLDKYYRILERTFGEPCLTAGTFNTNSMPILVDGKIYGNIKWGVKIKLNFTVDSEGWETVISMETTAVRFHVDEIPQEDFRPNDSLFKHNQAN